VYRLELVTATSRLVRSQYLKAGDLEGGRQRDRNARGCHFSSVSMLQDLTARVQRHSECLWNLDARAGKVDV